jgi:hypothetical protein
MEETNEETLRQLAWADRYELTGYVVVFNSEE